jgi:hypothetical protein
MVKIKLALLNFHFPKLSVKLIKRIKIKDIYLSSEK